jgi:DNA-binding YbaB/EbfC family protein
VVGEAGAGLVKVTMTGRHDVRAVKIAPELLQDEPALLEDLLAAAVNDAVRKVERVSQERMSGMAQGLNLPPGFKLPF